ncbi:HNH endonuclease [Fuscibacter oryzae]|uniref:HNH endonuclease n=1 Tax=Fuscibacter oryzae TaxID=2803939 RepID=A0A8J7MMW0_9RHOB|nr:HNH endonuclease [Fuscibacter oryzae]MBL4927780.1 HNH endonuclease [Fuscibacter oryzae]
MLTQQRLRQVLDYDPDTGVFTFVKGSRKGRIAGTRHDDRGFLKVSIASHYHLLHRLAWLWMTGTMPRSNIEHINGDRSDNRWKNLREAGRSQKEQHCPPRPEPTATRGVWKIGDAFEAMVLLDEAVINLGRFETEELAAAAIKSVYARARKRIDEQRRRAA